MAKRNGLLVLLTVLALLAMTMGGTFAQDATVAPTETPIVTELGTGGTHISFWNGLTGSDGVTLNAMLADFVVAHPEISVTTEIIPWGTLYTKLQAAFVAGQPPDMFLLHASEIPQFASYGVLKDLSSWYTSGGGWLPDDDLSATTLAGVTYQDVKYGVPLDNHGRGLWINRTAFENVGLDPDMEQPTTYEGWVELFQQLTIDANGNNAASPDFDPENVAQWGFGVGEWPNVNFQAAIVQNGGRMFSEDMSTVLVNSEAGITALQQFIDLVYTYHVSPPASGFDTWAAYAGGQLAIIPTGTWFRNYQVDQTDIDGQAWPNFQFGPERAAWFGMHTFMVPVNQEGEKLDAVQTLIQWVSENQVAWAASGQVPARLSAQAQLDPVNYPSNILLGQSFAEYGVQDAQHVAIQEMYAALDPELNAALNGQKTAEQALNDAAARMQQVLDRTN